MLILELKVFVLMKFTPLYGRQSAALKLMALRLYVLLQMVIVLTENSLECIRVLTCPFNIKPRILMPIAIAASYSHMLYGYNSIAISIIYSYDIMISTYS